VDALHVQRCGVPLAALRAVDPALISYVQLCDAPLAAPGAGPASADAVHEARAARLLPGAGQLPLRELLAALPDGIPVAVEAPRSGHRGGSPAEFAARARRALDSVLSQATSQSKERL
jgi:sugar phosphate isomerase/epimerase